MLSQLAHHLLVTSNLAKVHAMPDNRRRGESNGGHSLLLGEPYLCHGVRPDIAHAVGVVSRFLSNPGKEHWEDVKWIFEGYFKDVLEGGPVLERFTDSGMELKGAARF